MFVSLFLLVPCKWCQTTLSQLSMEKLPKWNKQCSRKCCSSWHTVCKHLKFLWVYCLPGLLKAKVPNEDLLGLHSFRWTFTICCAWTALTLQICNTLDQCFWGYWIKLTFFHSRKITAFLKEVEEISKMPSLCFTCLCVSLNQCSMVLRSSPFKNHCSALWQGTVKLVKIAGY